MTTNARTDPNTGLRLYDWQGKEYVSVTSIRKLVGMPFTLHNWALSQVIDRAVVQHHTITAMLEREKRPRERTRDTNVLKEVRSYLRGAATEERDRAGDVGTRAHEAIAAGLTPDQCPADIFGFVAQFGDFMRTTGARLLWSERQVWNLKYHYAGTADALIEMPDGRVLLVDYKTSKGIYLDHAIQLIGYAMCDFVGENDIVDAVATQGLLSASGIAILHLSEQAWELVEIKPDRDTFAGFVGSLAFALYLHRHNDTIEGLVLNRTKGGTLVPALARSLRLIQSSNDPTPQEATS